MAALLALPAAAPAQTSLLEREDLAHLEKALARLDMTFDDLAFEKDLGKPVVVFTRNRELLHNPLRVAERGAAAWAAVTSGTAAIWGWAAENFETPIRDATTQSDIQVTLDAGWTNLDPDLIRALESFFAAAARARLLVDEAFAALSPEERAYLAAAPLADFLRVEDFPERAMSFQTLGISSNALEGALAESADLDPEPEARSCLEMAQRIQWNALLAGARVFQQAVCELADRAGEVTRWPQEVPVELRTTFGKIAVGTAKNDRFDEPVLLILDPGGDEHYGPEAGFANGLTGNPLAAIVDLSGNDRYGGGPVAGGGAALFGVSVLCEREGDDVYETDGMGQGGALFGVAWLDDFSGDDVYRAGFCAQGAAQFGFGILRDDSGNDSYRVGLCGQAWAGVMAVGALIDAKGNDFYYAGGREPDFERNDDRFVSLAQGCALGMRPFAGGGVALLADREGNDEYVADVYGQGVGYWYALGMLVDAAGNDRYVVHQYGQGTGIHLSAGLLADLAGNDSYAGAVLAQGSAHDYAVGVFLDKGGDDVYVGRQHAQGRALNNALALLLDGAGNDSYFARQCDECQGIGNDGDKREYGSLALLLDLSGDDYYTCGGADGAMLERPDFGIIYDVTPEGETP